MRSTSQLPWLVAATALAAAAAENGSTSAAPVIQFKPSPDAGNAHHVDQGYLGFGIEMKSFPQYAGVNKTNILSNNLISTISNRTGAPVHVRVGGTSMDNSVFDKSFGETTGNTSDSNLCRLHTNVTIGSQWLQAFRNMPAATRFTLQVPLARRNLSNAMEFAKTCIDAMPNKVKQLGAIEIGNEPNYYPTFPRLPCHNPDRQEGWGPSDYAREWTVYANNFTEKVDALQGHQSWFQAMTFASATDQSVWNISKMWDSMGGEKFTKTVSLHYYQGNSCSTLENALMDHNNTVRIMESKFRRDIRFLNASKTPFILGEVGSAIGSSGGCEKNPDLYGSLGAALWNVDFLLYGMTMGIHRVSMQLGTNFDIASWQPVNTKLAKKAVKGNYYGQVFAADFIGTTGNLQIKKLGSNSKVVGYAGYNKGKLTKVAALNMEFWDASGSGNQTTKNLSLSQLDSDVKSVKVSRLTAPNGAKAQQGITWAGQSWTAASDGIPQPNQPTKETVEVKGGSLIRNIPIRASEGLLIELVRS